jgi:fructokinase
MRLGIDLGGTKIELAGLHADGSEVGRMRVPTPEASYEAVVSALADAVRAAEERWGPADSVGMGTPGAIDPGTGLLKNSNSTVLNGRPLFEDARKALGRDLRMANDADCFALSEATDGAAAGATTVFGVIVGTGVGGGVVVRGRLLSGPNAIAGEWGHNPLPWPAPDETPGPHCYCGRRGCIETFVSGPGLAADHERATGEKLGPGRIDRRAADGDAASIATLDRYIDRLARSLATVINIIDPEVVVLGGGVSNVDRLYTDVPETWSQYVFSGSVSTKLVRAVHGDSSGVRGAARLWAD